MFYFLTYSWFWTAISKSFCKGTKKLTKKERFFVFFCNFAQKKATTTWICHMDMAEICVNNQKYEAKK